MLGRSSFDGSREDALAPQDDGLRADNMPLRLIFMGTPDFAVPTLVELAARGHEIVAVYTRAAKPAGRRGLERVASPVEREAKKLGVPVANAGDAQKR